MKFYDDEHRDFYNEKLQALELYGKADVYYKSLVYVLGICPVTREHFKDIFDIGKGKINIDSLHSPYQTGTSAKTTRMAFSLWNRCLFDSTEDIENVKYSPYYNPSEIFCCSYAPYFYEGIKIRYPEYTRDKNTIKEFER